MLRTVVTAAMLSAVSCATVLIALSTGLVSPLAAAAQVSQVIQARGFEVVDVNGNRLAYLGEAQFSPAILVLGEHSEVQVTSRSRVEAQPRIQLKTAEGALVWEVPAAGPPPKLLGFVDHAEYCRTAFGAESGRRASPRILRDGGYGCGWIPADPALEPQRRVVDLLAACRASFGEGVRGYAYTDKGWECWG